MKRQLIIFLVLGILLAACSSPAAPTATTAPAAPTEAPTAAPTEAPPPTEAPTSTPEPTADLAATAAVQATADAEALLAALADEISQELTTLGLSTEGNLVFLQADPIAIVANQQDFDGVYEDAGIDPVGDFAWGFDMTWETETGFSGCGFIFRAENDMDRGQQVRFYTTRLSGLPFWAFAIYRYGQWQVDLADGVNSAIKNGQGSTNHFVVSAHGPNVIFYVNGTRVGATTLPAARATGRFGYLTWEDSGISTCTFSNGWVVEYPND
ncbi:MAG: hypothetical protein WEA61_01930 [Anaerolineales bacterium]